MPVALGALLFAGPLGAIFSFGTLVAASSALIGLGLSLAVNMAFRPKAPAAPRPEDGKYNLRQNVPSLTVVLGTVKKASDYDVLEEKGGTAFHVLVPACHRISGYVKHSLHDEEVTLDAGGLVTAPAHFGGHVRIHTRLGLNAETAYGELIAALPAIWTADHRGDGLASVLMTVGSTSQEEHMDVFPQQMPAHSSVIDGALVLDPRQPGHDPDDPSTWAFSRNLALLRLFHLTHPSGGKMTFDDMHLPDWRAAADICDEQVLNRAGGSENRYHGGLWYRYENDQVEIGRIIDQAGELVLYETAEGKVGVHAGRFVAPDVRLTEADIIAVTIDANRRKNTNVLAVRGQFTDPGKQFNTVDAAIYGNPYIGDASERTKTVANVAVQSHNHIQRLQKLAMQRANAPRVQVLCHYEPAKKVPYRRFITVHYPPKMNESLVEIIGRPQLSVQKLTYQVEGIVWGEIPYGFVAATEEGAPPADIIDVTRDAIPVPAGFDVAIQTEIVAGGASAAFGLATWAAQSAALIVEVEWVPTAGGTAQSAQTKTGDINLRTNYLADGTQYKFRARNWSAGAPGAWTTYVTRTAITDLVPPQALVSFAATGGNGNATFSIATASGDLHLSRIAVYRVPTGVTLDKAVHTKIVIGAAPGTSFSYVDGDATTVNLFGDPGFATGTGWSFNTGWALGSGKADHTSAADGGVSQAFTFVGAVPYRYGVNIVSQSAAGTGVNARFGPAPLVPGLPFSGVGKHFGKLTPNASNTVFGFRASTAVVSIDDVVLFKETAACAPQDVWDYYPFPLNASGIEGPAATPVTGVVIY